MKRIFGLFCAAAVFSCGVSAGPPTPRSYPEYLRLSSQLTCETRLRCCGTLCGSAEDTAVESMTAQIGAYLDSARIGFDASAAASCLVMQSRRMADCGAAVDDLTPAVGCDKVLVPQNPVGGICEPAVTSCIPGTSCMQNRCTMLPKLGDSCTAAIGCTPPAYCNTGAAPIRCAMYAEAGQSCGTAGALCNPSSGTLLCHPNLICLQPQPNGAACSSGGHCQSGFCDLSTRLCAASGGTPKSLTLREELCASAP